LTDKENEFGDLDKVLYNSWQMIQRGVTHFKDPFHFPVLGTVGDDECNLRTVILRQFDEKKRILVCHSDKRATKVKELAKNNNISWLFYHPKKNIQLSIWGKGQLHIDDDFADEKWGETRLPSRLNYCSELPSGTPIDGPVSGIPGFLLNKALTLLNTARGRKNFVSISCKIGSMDWLRLSVLGNTRARFVWKKNKLKANWIIP